MLQLKLGTETYDLATTLRVAYEIQGLNNHRSYLEVFQDIDTMTLEQQIGIVYSAFKVANREKAQFMKLNEFTDKFMDEHNLMYLMNLIKEIIEGITGKNEEDTETSSFLTGTNSSN